MYVRFHIGRGGRFYNQGHLSFVNEDNFQDLISACGDKLFDNREAYDENTDTTTPLDDKDWNLSDENGRVLVQGREAMEAMTGRLEWDGDYDTDYVVTVDDLSDNEIECLWEEYRKEAWMSDELKDAVCELKDKKRVHNIRRYPCNLAVTYQDDFSAGGECCTDIDFDQMQGELTRDEWKSRLEGMDFCPLSVEFILDTLEGCYTNDTDFFKED